MLLGIDIGTSAAKAVICDEGGRVLGAGAAEYPLSRPHVNWSEQDPRDWWAGAIAATHAALSSEGVARAGGAAAVAGVGLSGQMHGSVLLGADAVAGDGRDAQPLRPAILWNDQRTAHECAEIEDRAGGRAALVGLVGNAALPGFTLPKLLWVRRHEPDVFARTRLVLLPKDYVRLRLTGQAATDVGDASGVLLLDVDRRAWSPRAIEIARIDSSLLPRVLESATSAGGLTAWAAGVLGLRAGIPVAAGSGDNQCGAIGAGVVRPGLALTTLGTSGVVYAHAEAPRRDLVDLARPGRLHTMASATGDSRRAGGWCVTGCMLSAAGALQWCRDTIAPGVAFDALLAEAARVRPGCDGLAFLPHLTGERCPYPDPDARGGWIGLTARHGRGHLVRAVLEGVSFTLARIMGIVREIGVPVRASRVGGGGARSILWRQMLADCQRCPVASTNTEDGPALGAAILGGVAAGVLPTVEVACDAMIHETEVLEPDARAPYAEAMAAHARLYGDLYEATRMLAKLDRG
ncbi:MAG: xylulokinase [Phycisphaerales bacterium]